MSGLSLSIGEDKMNYEFEYLGDCVLSYQVLTANNLRMMSKVVKNVKGNEVSLLESKQSISSARLVSEMSGKFYKRIDLV